MGRPRDVRKIQKTGRNTFIVSLPKAWADARNVSAGTPAYVTQNEDGSLTIDVNKHTTAQIATVNADAPQALRHTISAYIAGAQCIVLNGDAATEVAESARSRHLAAVDVISEAHRQVTLRVFATGQEYSLFTLLRRLHAVVLSLFDAAETVFSKPADAARIAERREREANRLYTLALRSLGAEDGHTAARFEALAANALENIADELQRFVTERPKHSKTQLAQVREAYEKTAAEFFDGKTGQAATAAHEELKTELEKLRLKSALEWARLYDVLRYCVELEDTAADVAAAKELTKSNTDAQYTQTSKTGNLNVDINLKAGKELR